MSLEMEKQYYFKGVKLQLQNKMVSVHRDDLLKFKPSIRKGKKGDISGQADWPHSKCEYFTNC